MKFPFKYCLKFCQYLGMLLLILYTSLSCGTKKNKNTVIQKNNEFNRNANFLLNEVKCNQSLNNSDTNQIEQYLNDLVEKVNSEQTILPSNAQIFQKINQEDYNEENPLIISSEILQKQFLEIKESTLENKVKIERILKLLNEWKRYEGQKCNYSQLVKQKKYDLLPFLYFSRFCENFHCKKEVLHNFSLSLKNYVLLCEKFKDHSLCYLEFKNQSQLMQITLIEQYLEKFNQLLKQKFFSLKENSPRFECLKNNENEKIVLKIKINTSKVSEFVKRDELDYIEKIWSNDKIQIKLDQTNDLSDDVVKIDPIDKNISHVDENGAIIHFGIKENSLNRKKILAHEFGHVLGFSDCYIEFFNSFNKTLVYYELKDFKNNIMCSLKGDGMVPKEYLEQIKAHSCDGN